MRSRDNRRQQGRRSGGRRETEVPFLQTGDHERVDRIGLTHLRDRDLPRRDERPMRFIRGPVADPLLQVSICFADSGL